VTFDNLLYTGTIHSCQLLTRFCVYLVSYYAADALNLATGSSGPSKNNGLWLLFGGMLMSTVGYIVFGFIFDYKWNWAPRIVTVVVLMHTAVAVAVSFVLLNSQNMPSWLVITLFVLSYLAMCVFQTCTGGTFHCCAVFWCFL